MQKLYTPQEIAEILRINEQTVLRFIREGKIKAVKAGRAYRISERALEDYLGLSTAKVDSSV